MGHELSKIDREVRRVGRQVDREVRRAGCDVERCFRKEVLPLVVGAGRKRVKTRHTKAEFTQDRIQLVVTGGDVVIQSVATPCAGGNHTDIVECDVKLEIEINGQGFVFNDKYCRACGTHFPIIA